MEVPTYVFQSPYPSAVQVGRPDPQAVSQEKEEEITDTLSQAAEQNSQETQRYQYETLSAASSVNIAQSLSDSALTSSLGTFSALHKQTQAIEAYTGQ